MKSTKPANIARRKKRIDDKGKVIDPDEIEKLALIGATLNEIKSSFKGIRDQTFHDLMKLKEYHEAFERGLEGSKLTVRRMLWKSAMEGNWPAIQHLCRYVLGHHEKVEIDIRSDVTLAALMDEMKRERAELQQRIGLEPDPVTPTRVPNNQIPHTRH